MNIKSNQCSGTIKISEDVIVDIAANVISETEGVTLYNSGRTVKFGNKPAISVIFKDGAAEITVLINVAFGSNVRKCAETIQEKIKSNVQDMTWVMVSKVNVKIISII